MATVDSDPQTEAATASGGPLTGLRVVELGSLIAGALTEWLSWRAAEVVPAGIALAAPRPPGIGSMRILCAAVRAARKAGEAMGVPLLVLVVVLTFVYLFYALLRPEKF